MDLNPGGIIAWVVIGLVAGWLAGLAMRGGGYGVVVDVIVGLRATVDMATLTTH